MVFALCHRIPKLDRYAVTVRLPLPSIPGQVNRKLPPWGSKLGGEICLHGGGVHADWTAGCVALRDADAETLFRMADVGTAVEILP